MNVNSSRPDIQMLFPFGGIQGETGPWSPVSAVGDSYHRIPSSLAAATVVSSVFSERLMVHTTFFLGPVCEEGE